MDFYFCLYCVLIKFNLHILFHFTWLFYSMAIFFVLFVWLVQLPCSYSTNDWVMFWKVFAKLTNFTWKMLWNKHTKIENIHRINYLHWNAVSRHFVFKQINPHNFFFWVICARKCIARRKKQEIILFSLFIHANDMARNLCVFLMKTEKRQQTESYSEMWRKKTI